MHNSQNECSKEREREKKVAECVSEIMKFQEQDHLLHIEMFDLFFC